MYFKYCFILLFISLQGLAQQPTKNELQFSFDQLIKVRETTLDSSTQALDYKTRLFYLLVNSKDNSYYATLTQLDSLQSHLKFVVFDSIRTSGYVKVSDFLKAEFIKVNCTAMYSYENSHNKKYKNYNSKILYDTIINDKIFGRYVFKNSKPKYEKRDKLWKYYYIIDKSQPALPFLNTNLTYEIYKKNTQLPKGRLVQEIYVNHEDVVVIKETFSEPIIIDKKILIDKTCNYYNRIIIKGLHSKRHF